MLHTCIFVVHSNQTHNLVSCVRIRLHHTHTHLYDTYVTHTHITHPPTTPTQPSTQRMVRKRMMPTNTQCTQRPQKVMLPSCDNSSQKTRTLRMPKTLRAAVLCILQRGMVSLSVSRCCWNLRQMWMHWMIIRIPRCTMQLGMGRLSACSCCSTGACGCLIALGFDCVVAVVAVY